MTERFRYHDHTKPVDTCPPKVDIIMAQIRPDDHPWVADAKRSVAEQSYPNLGLIVVDNLDRSLTIGSAWNAAVAHSDADMVLLLGDDDALSADLVSSMVHGWQHLQQQAPNLVHMTTHCTVVDDISRATLHAPVQHTGMFLRRYLVDDPFDADLDRHVGHAKLRAISEAQKALGQPMSMAILHHYGYIYRQHAFMTNGRPIRIQPQQHAHR